MFQETTTKRPARAESGMKLANGAAASMKIRRKTACNIPATGLIAPARMLLAVRAIVPVTLIAHTGEGDHAVRRMETT